MSKKVFAAIILCLAFAFGYAWHAQPASASTPQLGASEYGYFGGVHAYSNFGGVLMDCNGGSVFSSSTTKQSFINEIMAFYNQGNNCGGGTMSSYDQARNKTGAAFIIQTMRQIKSSDNPSKSPGASVTNDWQQRIQSPDIRIVWDSSYSWYYNTGYMGQSTPGSANDDAYWPDPGGAHSAILFQRQDSNGNWHIIYALKSDCGNPVGDLPGLPPPPPDVFWGNMRGTTTRTSPANTQPGQQVTWNINVYDGGGVGTDPTQGVTFTVHWGSATTSHLPGKYKDGSCAGSDPAVVNADGGGGDWCQVGKVFTTSSSFQKNFSITVPSAAVNGDKYCIYVSGGPKASNNLNTNFNNSQSADQDYQDQSVRCATVNIGACLSTALTAVPSYGSSGTAVSFAGNVKNNCSSSVPGYTWSITGGASGTTASGTPSPDKSGTGSSLSAGQGRAHSSNSVTVSGSNGQKYCATITATNTSNASDTSSTTSCFTVGTVGSCTSSGSVLLQPNLSTPGDQEVGSTFTFNGSVQVSGFPAVGQWGCTENTQQLAPNRVPARNINNSPYSVTANGYQCSSPYSPSDIESSAYTCTYTYNAEVVCPAGDTDTGSSCTSPATPQYSCPGGWSLSGTTCTAFLGKDNCKPSPITGDGQGNCSQPATLSYYCSSGGTLNGTTCTDGAANITCPQGGTSSTSGSIFRIIPLLKNAAYSTSSFHCTTSMTSPLIYHKYLCTAPGSTETGWQTSPPACPSLWSCNPQTTDTADMTGATNGWSTSAPTCTTWQCQYANTTVGPTSPNWHAWGSSDVMQSSTQPAASNCQARCISGTGNAALVGSSGSDTYGSNVGIDPGMPCYIHPSFSVTCTYSGVGIGTSPTAVSTATITNNGTYSCGSTTTDASTYIGQTIRVTMSPSTNNTWSSPPPGGSQSAWSFVAQNSPAVAEGHAVGLPYFKAYTGDVAVGASTLLNTSQNPTCASGDTPSGNNCNHTYSPTICDSGDMLVGTSCYHQYTITCPSGYTLNANTCSRTYTSSLVAGTGNPVGICNTGDTPAGNQPVGTTCTHTYPASSATNTTYSCPSGGSLSGTTCTTTYGAYASSYSYTYYTCPSGYTLTYTTSYVCTYSYTATYQSTTTSSSSSGCSSAASGSIFRFLPFWGLHTAADSCGSTTTTSASSAASGSIFRFLPSWIFKTAASGYYCPSGGTLSGTTCTITTSATANTGYGTSYSCNSGDTLSGTTCTHTYAATGTTNTTYSCNSGDTLSGTTCTHHYTANNSTDSLYQCDFGDTPTNVSNTPITCTNIGLSGVSCPTGGGSTCTQYTAHCNSGDVASGTTCTYTYQKLHIATAACSVNNSTAGVFANANTSIGAGTQLAALAPKSILNFFTAQYNNGSNPSPTVGSSPNALTFANDTTWGGNFGGVPACRSWLSNVNFNQLTASPTPQNQALASDDTKIISDATKQTQFIYGDVYIVNNIIYDNTGSWTDVQHIPNYQLVVQGNIYISSSVTRLDGEYVALPTKDPNTGTISGGQIYDCASGTVNPDGTASNLAAIGTAQNGCESQLVVNGAFVAKKINLLRDCGSRKYSNTSEATVYAGGTDSEQCSGGNHAAEVFNYTPEQWIGSISPQPSSRYQSVANLPPVL